MAALLRSGESIGRYRIERLIGQGGMGQVYLATHTDLGRPVAIKTLKGDYTKDPRLVARFLNEARAVAGLKHTNIIDITDLERTPDGRHFMVLEYLKGETLAQLLARRPRLEPTEANVIVAQLCAACGAAHERGIIHRDLKPPNVFLVAQPGRPPLVKVLDFGIAKLKSRSGDATAGGVVLGTPEFMAPEQALGRSDQVCPESDVYSVGVISFCMLTGSLPFDGEPGLILDRLTREPAPLLRSRVPTLSEPLERVIDKALRKQPRQRWRAMANLARAFELALTGGGTELDAMIERCHRDAEETAPQSPSSLSHADQWDEPTPSSVISEIDIEQVRGDGFRGRRLALRRPILAIAAAAVVLGAAGTFLLRPVRSRSNIPGRSEIVHNSAVAGPAPVAAVVTSTGSPSAGGVPSASSSRTHGATAHHGKRHRPPTAHGTAKR